MTNKQGIDIKEKLEKELEDYFGSDIKRINHALSVLNFAEKIFSEEGGDQDIIEAAAILHDIGIHEAEKKHGSSGGHFQEIEGPPIAKNILEKIGFPTDKLQEVLDIIANHHSPGKIKTLNFQVLYEADWLVNIGDEVDISNKDKVKEVINKVFSTGTGKRLALELYLNN